MFSSFQNFRWKRRREPSVISFEVLDSFLGNLYVKCSHLNTSLVKICMKVNKSDILDKCNISTHFNVPVAVCVFSPHNLFSQISVNRIPIFLQLFFYSLAIPPDLNYFWVLVNGFPIWFLLNVPNLGIIKPAQNKNSSKSSKMKMIAFYGFLILYI